MLTRKDVLPETIEERVMAQDSEELKKLLHLNEKSATRTTTTRRGFQLFRSRLGLSANAVKRGAQAETTSQTTDDVGAPAGTSSTAGRTVSFHPKAS
jgi:hypothetical protein